MMIDGVLFVIAGVTAIVLGWMYDRIRDLRQDDGFLERRIVELKTRIEELEKKNTESEISFRVNQIKQRVESAMPEVLRRMAEEEPEDWGDQ